jgi:hypothetical protein
VHHSDVKGLNALEEEMSLRQKWIVSTETHVRNLGNNCFAIPWEKYLENIWGDFGSF